MIIDVSANQGHITWSVVKENEDIEKVILRSTTRNGEPDLRLVENINGIRVAYDSKMPIDIYKFTYAFTYEEAAAEATKVLYTVGDFVADSCKGFTPNMFWLDIEPVDGRVHTPDQCDKIIAAYANVCKLYNVPFGIYCNYTYLMHYMRPWTKIFPFWIARWNDKLGDTQDFKVKMWQYSDKGHIAGIDTVVDLSRFVK